jgi:purine-nucleoside phosphorylase
MSASTPSSFGEQFGVSGSIAPTADYTLLSEAVKEAERISARYHVGSLLSSDVFYNADPDFNKKWAKMGVLAIEMEAAALYMNASYAKKRALAICTVSDEIFTGINTTSEERRSTFIEMMEIALRVAVNMEK